MKQIAWEKTEYEAGHTFGQNFDMQTLPPFLFDGQRMEFGKACLQICRRVYPSVVEEMEGIAQGAGMELEKLSAFLFGIYAFPPFQGCSCFAAADEEEIFFGRNSDFLPAAKEQSLSSIYKIEGKKSFLANSTTPVQVEDGVNEDGLAVGLTFLFPTVRKPGLNAGLLVRYLLEHCSSVPEAIAALGALPISSMQTLTVADRQGRMAVVECNCEAMEVRYPKQGERFVAATNHFCAESLWPYQTTMPDRIHSHKRLETLERALQGKDRYSRTFLQELLAGKQGFLCQYEPREGMDTIWSALYCLRSGEAFFCFDNPSKAPFHKDERFFF